MIETRQNFLALLKEVSNFELLKSLPSKMIEDLMSESKVIFNSHRGILYSQGSEADSFGIVLNGAYKLVKAGPDGSETVIHFSIAGDVIGALLMTQDAKKFPVSAIAMGPSRFLKISKNTYLKYWAVQPELLLRIQSLLADRLTLIRDQKALLRAPLTTRIASLLIALADKGHRDGESDSHEIPIPMTRKDIAESLGVSVEAVIRVMSDWSKRKIISTNDFQISILSPVQLITEGQKL